MPSDPLRDLLSLPDQLDRLTRREGAGWLPPVDVYETGDRYIVSVELPGMDQSDFEIDARDGELWLRGRRQAPARAPNAYHQMERGHGLFERRFLFAEPIDVPGISAEMRDGVLTIAVPKRGPKQIEIR
jgi:HSP20 family protein